MSFDLRIPAIPLLALLLAFPTVAVAQSRDVDSGGVREFEPLYFVAFAPLTALDMVNRIPGVSAQESDGGRGLSGVRSNLLINGVRPPPKGKSARDQLREMPVRDVILIELIDAGARLEVDMQGYSQVINVITEEKRPAYYEVMTEAQRSGTGAHDQENERSTRLEAMGSFPLGDHQLTVTGNIQDHSNRSPSGFVAIDPANPSQRVSSLNTSDRKQEFIQFDAMFALPGESSLSFNSQFSQDSRGSEPVSLAENDELTPVDESNARQNDRRAFSAEYRRPLATNGEITLAFVDTTDTNQSESIFRTFALSRFSLSDSETGETAARLLVTNAPTDRLTVRTTVSNAFNYFTGGFTIFENDVEINIDGSDSRVQEDRRSLESAVDWNLTDKWTFRGNVGVEAYEINTRDVASGLQTDPKGEISVSFRPQPRTTFTLSTRRSVGQLSFNQFLASSSLSSEILTAGAIGLEPERQRTVEASYDRRFGDQGVMRFSLARIETENPVNSVALSDALIISQNTSPQITDRLQVSVDFPFERFGNENLILSISGNFFDSKTIDPITGETREVSSGGFGGGGFGGFTPRHFKRIQLRKDPGDGKWSWSVSLQDMQPTGNYSVRQVRQSSGNREWNTSVTWEPIGGLRFRINLDGPRTETSEAFFFGAVRAPGLDPTFIARTMTRRGHAASFNVEWRRERFEITGNLSSRPDNHREESLVPFGETIGSFLTTEVARSPRAMLRVRFRR